MVDLVIFCFKHTVNQSIILMFCEGNLPFKRENIEKKYKKSINKAIKQGWAWRAFVVTSTQNHQIIHLFNIIKILSLLATEFQSDRVTEYTGRWNFLCLISINSTTCFARRAIIFWWCLNRYYSMILIWCYYLVSAWTYLLKMVKTEQNQKGLALDMYTKT